MSKEEEVGKAIERQKQLDQLRIGILNHKFPTGEEFTKAVDLVLEEHRKSRLPSEQIIETTFLLINSAITSRNRLPSGSNLAGSLIELREKTLRLIETYHAVPVANCEGIEMYMYIADRDRESLGYEYLSVSSAFGIVIGRVRAQEV